MLCCVALSCLGRSVDRSVCYEIVGFSFMRNVRFSRVGPTIFLLLFRFVLVAILFGLRVYVVVLVVVIVGRKVQKFKFFVAVSVAGVFCSAICVPSSLFYSLIGFTSFPV